MKPLLALAHVWALINSFTLWVGRGLGAACVGLMLVIILAQVFYRYVLGNALPWPDEAARFLMLWMTGLMAPTAFRRGGFVGIDMLTALLPRALAAVIGLIMFGVILVILWVGFHIGWAEVTGLGGRFRTDSLNIPTSFDFSTWMRLPRSTALASLAVGVTIMLSVCGELILRQIITLLGGGTGLTPIAQPLAAAGAE